MLLGFFFINGCATVSPQLEQQKNTQLFTKEKEKAKLSEKELKEKSLITVNLRQAVPLKALIEAICKSKNLSCDVAGIDQTITYSGRVYRGGYQEFFNYLEEAYGLKIEKVGDTYLFSTTDRAGLKRLEKVIPVNVKDVSFDYLISLLSDQAGIPIKLEDVDRNLKISYFSLRKTLRQILDEITSQLNLYWKYEKGKILIGKYQRAVFQLALPYVQKEISVEGSNFKFSYDKKFLLKLEDSLKSILTDPKSKVAVSQSGYVLVSARPSEVRQIAEFINRLNKQFTKVIPLQLTIVAIDLSDKYSSGINLMQINKIGAGKLPYYITGKVLGDKGLQLGITGTDVDLIINFFEKFGNIRIVEKTELRTLNGQPIVYAPEITTRIISNFQLSYVPVGGGATGTTATTTQPTLTTETEDLKEGTDLIIVPHYLGRGKIILDLYRSQSQIISLTPFQINLSGYENQLVLPTLKKASTVQQTVLSKGESVVLLSSVVNTEDVVSQGVPALKDIPVVGEAFGQRSKKTKRVQYLLIITYR